MIKADTAEYCSSLATVINLSVFKMMQHLFSTEAILKVRGDSHKTRSFPQNRMYDDDYDIEERHAGASPRQGRERREDSSEIEVESDGPAVSSSHRTKLFSLITKRNWSAAVKRCRGEGAMEAMTWIVEKNADDSIRWKLLPIHQVSI